MTRRVSSTALQVKPKPQFEVVLVAYEHILQPLRVGTLKLPNRLVMAPMGTGYGDTQHRVTPRLIAYHVARARGGMALNIIEHTAVHPLGLTGPTMPGVYSDEQTEGWARLTAAVHQAGGRVALQLQHGGRQANPDVIGQECLSASECRAGRDRRIAREMTEAEIWEVVEAFGKAARRCQEAGMDGVEVHMAHGYLGNSFLSPWLNCRNDQWGGDTERRTRFAKEVIGSIRNHCGTEFPVWCRVSAEDYVEEGMHLEEMQKVAPLLEAYGYAMIHVSTGSAMASVPYYVAPGHLLPLAAGVKEVVNVPVIGVGSINRAELAEQALADGVCDLIAMGRQALADPEIVRKLQQGRGDDIIPCYLCAQGCQERSFSGGQVQCAINPYTGRENDWPDWPAGPPATQRKKVLVAGGGPAGMQAALTASLRGHDVTLCEKTERLGGAFWLAAAAPGKQELERPIEYLTDQLASTDADVHLGEEVTAELVAAGEFDNVIIATGARPRDLASLPGQWDGEFVSAAQVLAGAAPQLQQPVAVIGGDVSGTNAAHLIAEAGKEVIVFEKSEAMAAGLPGSVRSFLLEALAELEVELITKAEVVAAGSGQVTAVVNGAEKTFEIGSVVVAVGREPVTELAEQLRTAGYKPLVIGDAAAPRHMQAAIYEGANAARTI